MHPLCFLMVTIIIHHHQHHQHLHHCHHHHPYGFLMYGGRERVHWERMGLELYEIPKECVDVSELWNKILKMSM